jgi:hypothetical protein
VFVPLFPSPGHLGPGLGGFWGLQGQWGVGGCTYCRSILILVKINQKSAKEQPKLLFLCPVYLLYCFTHLFTTPKVPWGVVLVFGPWRCVLMTLSEDATQCWQLPGSKSAQPPVTKHTTQSHKIKYKYIVM